MTVIQRELTHLQALEAEAIHVMREVAAELAEDPDGVRFAHPEDAMPDEVAICAGLHQKGII